MVGSTYRLIVIAVEDCPHPLNSYDAHDLFPDGGVRTRSGSDEKRSLAMRSIPASSVVRKRSENGLIRRQKGRLRLIWLSIRRQLSSDGYPAG